MREGGRIAAAIEVLDEIAERHRPASDALRDWGRNHRFAGSGDRHAIATLVYDVLRRKNSLAFRMGEDTSRALVFAALHDLWRRPLDQIASSVIEEHGPGALSEAERAALERAPASDPPAHVAGDFPQWLAGSFERAFGEEAAEEGRALAERAPLDLRVNIIKANRPRVLKALAKFEAVAGPLSPWCVRIATAGLERRSPHVEVEPAHGKGWYEVQDAASQVAALMSGARPGEQVADICAGSGGKTLALAALMANKGQIHAYDSDKHRLRPIFERLMRAGARNVQVLGADEAAKLQQLQGKMDCVVIDAPCSGSGAWRRNPDSKWRLTEKQLAQRIGDQKQVLAQGASLVKAGGRLLYITCSVLPEENDDQVEAFLGEHPDFALVPWREQWLAALGTEPPSSAGKAEEALLLTPRRHQTDGFFIALLRKGASPAPS